MTNWAQIFPDLLFYAYVGIHEVKILVFNIITKRVMTRGPRFRPYLPAPWWWKNGGKYSLLSRSNTGPQQITIR